MNWGTFNELLQLNHYKQLRASSPFSFHAEHRYWDIYKYEPVKKILLDHENFSSQGEQNDQDPIDSSILRQDPPKHRQLRRFVSQAFTPRMIESLQPKIDAIAHQLCDEAERRGAIDALHDFASPLPITVIAEMLGVPASDRQQFKQWSDSLVGNDRERYYECQREMSIYFGDIMNARRREPQDDLVSELVQATIEGEQLSDLEIIGFCILLLVAGNETTTNLITSALICLDCDREARAQLLSNPLLIPQALEETLRYCSPVRMTSRMVTRDVELCGQSFQAGQFVNVAIGSANHDEEQFANPERFDIHRSPNAHLAFGHGIHFCLGAQLARIEAKAALTAFLQRFPDYQCDPSYQLERQDSWMIFGVTRLPLLLNLTS
ncbi:cytochrome P450 [Paenibacillus sp. GCM10027626]|uniref:cytochrome P450 n=1 Tax=Paenibacillus sp. GCM10027626 TaxID=3273411 RepID=UPI003628821D